MSIQEIVVLEPQFHELAFASWIAYLVLIVTWKRLIRQDQEPWRYALIMLVGASFYLINHYFRRAPFYGLLHNGYVAVFLVIYYFVLVRQMRASALRKTLAFLSSLLFTVMYMLPEFFAKLAVYGKIIPGVKVPEALFLFIAFVAWLWIILAARPRQERSG